jgi:hypothetical protein
MKLRKAVLSYSVGRDHFFVKLRCDGLFLGKVEEE